MRRKWQVVWQTHAQRPLRGGLECPISLSQSLKEKTADSSTSSSKGANGGYFPAVSTKQTTEPLAIETAFKWLREGRPAGNIGNIKNDKNDGGDGNDSTVSISLSFREAAQNIKTAAEAEFICKELKRQGLLKNYIVSESRQAVGFLIIFRTSGITILPPFFL